MIGSSLKKLAAKHNMTVKIRSIYRIFLPSSERIRGDTI